MDIPGERGQGLNVLKVPHSNGLSVIVAPDKPTIDIVFIHGFTGDPHDTWACKSGPVQAVAKSDRSFNFLNLDKLPSLPRREKPSSDDVIYWPRDLVPSIAPKARVLTYGYDTHIRHHLQGPMSRCTVYDLAWGFLVSLEAARRYDPLRALVFIAHSLGGIVVKEALRRSRGCDEHQIHLRTVYDHTAGIIFFGTPHGGADPRSLVHHIAGACAKIAGFSVNEQVMNTLLPSSERLKELRDEFGAMVRQEHWVIHSFQEQYGVKLLNNKKVVEDSASCLNDPSIEVTQYIACNHMEMCQFNGLDDGEFGKLGSALTRILAAIANEGLPGEKAFLTAPERQKLLESLQFEQLDARHATIKSAHTETCGWLLDNREYKDWLDASKFSEHHGFLWIKGKPGTGKSTIMKFAFANAMKVQSNSIVASFFFNARGDEIEKSMDGMYRSLLYQFLRNIPELHFLLDIFRPRGRGGTSFSWDIEILKDLFSHTVQGLGDRRLTCFIDAVNECDEDQVREMVSLFGRLGHMSASKCRFYVCFSSRHYPHITFDKGTVLVLEREHGHHHDIAKYLHRELKVGPVLRMREEILKKSSGIFLWVVLVVAILNKEYDRGRFHVLWEKLNDIPSLDELLGDLLTRDGEVTEEQILCLQWVLYARRPLKPRELYHAILSGVDAKATLKNLERQWNCDENIEKFILHASKGLTEMTSSTNKVVQFIHESVSDYLQGKGLGMLRPNMLHNFPGLSHEILKDCCEKYIKAGASKCLELIRGLEDVEYTDDYPATFASEELPFLSYAVENILYHADSAQSYGISQDAFLQDFSDSLLKGWIYLSNLASPDHYTKLSDGMTLLNVLATRNLPHLISLEAKRDLSIDTDIDGYGSPLSIVSRHFSGNALKALLSPDTFILGTNATNFTEASQEDEIAVEILQKHRREVGFRYYKLGYLLGWAAGQGHLEVMKLLLRRRGIIIMYCSKYWWRVPLIEAAKQGHVKIVKLLLMEPDIEINSTGIDGKSALLWAVERGHKEVVKALLSQSDIDVDTEDRSKQKAIHIAEKQGHNDIVRLLLARAGGLLVRFIDQEYRPTPISQAASEGHESTSKMVSNYSNTHVYSNGILPAEALALPVAPTRHEVMLRCFSVADVTAQSSTTKERKVSPWAAEARHEKLVNLLSYEPDVDIDPNVEAAGPGSLPSEFLPET